LLPVPGTISSYRPWDAGSIPAGTSFVQTCEIDKLTTEMVKNCKTYCTVSLVPNPDFPTKLLKLGSAIELQNIQKVMTYTYDIQLKNGSCGDYDEIVVPIDQTPPTVGENLVPLLAVDNFYGGDLKTDLNGWYVVEGSPNGDVNVINTWAMSDNEKESYGVTLNKALDVNKYYRFSFRYSLIANGDNKLNNLYVYLTSEKHTRETTYSPTIKDKVNVNGTPTEDIVSTGPLEYTGYHLQDVSVVFKPSVASRFLVVYPTHEYISGSWITGSTHTCNLSVNEWKSNACTVTHSLCFKWTTPIQIPSIAEYDLPNGEFINHWEPKPCVQITAEKIRQSLNSQKNDIVTAKLAAYSSTYSNLCGSAENLTDNLSLSYELGYHHYTLYYYDRAGNLLRTVPPAGVDKTFLAKS
jgi:hypothetical protein